MQIWLQLRRIGSHGMCLLALLPGVCPRALAAPAFPIGLGPATRAVLIAHPELAGDTFELAAHVSARESDPVLRAGSLQTWPAPSTEVSESGVLGRVRLQCQSSEVCLPFYVLVHLSSRATPTVKPVSAAMATVAKTEGIFGTHTLRHGAHVHLVIDSGLLHLRLPVICLQDGDPGGIIRVQSVDRHVIYQATVVDTSTVRGAL